ncbi:hypothetical protein [Botrimarina hoheduenensis]|uniref:Uncharacterized protein n=1 Tax=Botrimarina hoheduenensis TaxID=2528000 RepID=A0A5C5VT89_9BACT|nr:hypothetical protein [Botrimarina hoheduenensis]TWT41313.1 hypothetical protein Pla111_30270 [Botrimarina hoheduenensis]
MSNKKPEPLMKPQSQKKCPFCGHASYSAGGVHPQCSRDQADKQRRELRTVEVAIVPSTDGERAAQRNRFNLSYQSGR